MLTSAICKQADFQAPWFQPWRSFFKSVEANGVHLGGNFLHRKEWEFVATAQALQERGMLEAGRKGIGFAVGHEPLPALFAACGCEVVATDSPSDNNGFWRADWAESKQALCRPEVCSSPLFDRNVRFAQVDMRSLPADLCGFDFSWSCCALEHLGSLQAGIDFLCAQFSCLRPGGVAVHTLEFNVSGDSSTLESGPTVLYRQSDLRRLVTALETRGHRVEPIDFTLGTSAEDSFIPVRPFHDLEKNLSHLRLRLGQFVTTSLILVMNAFSQPSTAFNGRFAGAERN